MVMATIWSIIQLVCLPGETRYSHQEDDRHSRWCSSQGRQWDKSWHSSPCLPETAWNNNLKFNPDNIQLKDESVSFWAASHPRWHEVRLKEVSAIRKMDTPQWNRKPESFQGMVNYLKHYSSRLTQLAEALKDNQSNDTLWCWKAKHQETFEAISDDLTKTPFVSILWQKGRPHDTSGWVKEGPWCGTTSERQTPHICIQNI